MHGFWSYFCCSMFTRIHAVPGRLISQDCTNLTQGRIIFQANPYARYPRSGHYCTSQIWVPQVVDVVGQTALSLIGVMRLVKIDLLV